MSLVSISQSEFDVAALSIFQFLRPQNISRALQRNSVAAFSETAEEAVTFLLKCKKIRTKNIKWLRRVAQRYPSLQRQRDPESIAQVGH